MVQQNKPVLFKPEYAESLLVIAQGDLETAAALIAAPKPGRLENILYMIQQGIEKTLKSVLIKKQISFPLVHDSSSDDVLFQA
jgi:HEPN domain-containing protein